MTKLRMQWMTVALLGLFVMGCQEPPKRLNSPPQGAFENRHPMRANMVYMVDNGMLEDMSMSDIHFVPHVAALNGAGARRLNRFSELLIVHGGTLHLHTREPESDLSEKRLALVRDYLKQSGVDMEKVFVEFGLSRAEGVDAETAIANKEKGTAQDQGVSTGGFKPTGMAPGSSGSPTGL